MNNKNIFFAMSIIIGFSIYGMENEWIGIECHWPSKGKGNKWSGYGSTIYGYCFHSRRDKNCAIINAYLLLMRYPEKNATQQIELYEKDILSIEQRIAHSSNFIDKRELQLSKLRLQSMTEQIKKTPIFGKPEDQDTQEKLGVAFNTILSKRDKDRIKNDLHFLRLAEKNAKELGSQHER